MSYSDPLHEIARRPFLPPPDPKAKLTNQGTRQYREHDELRYSMRSVAAATDDWSARRWHVVSNSYLVPANGGTALADSNETALRQERRLGQVPQWLDLDKAQTEQLHFHHG